MYSDDDLLSDKPSILDSFGESWPYLLIYEEEENRHRQNSYVFNDATDSVEEAARKAEDRKAASLEGIRLYRCLRFFKSLTGFHQGTLDLTGRHLSRYIPLQKSWNIYLFDLVKLPLHITQTTTEESSWDGVVRPVDHYTFDDESIWENFRQKWKISAYFDYELLVMHTRTALETLSEFPVPRFQTLHLVHLPTEILDVIFQYADLDKARLLSSTCRQLNEVGNRFIFRRRRLCFDLPWQTWDDVQKLSTSKERDEFLIRLAYIARENFLASCNFLSGRKDLLDKLYHISLSDAWVKSTSFGYLDLFEVSELDDGKFLAPIYTSIETTLPKCRHITSLHLYNIDLTLPILKIICGFSNLYVLQLRLCNVPPATIVALLENRGTLFSSSILNLYLYGPLEIIENLWFCLLFCPRLRNLSARANLDSILRAPPIVLWPVFRFYSSLERVYLGQVSPYTVTALAEWLGLAIQNASPSCLSHVKLQIESCLHDAAVLTFLRALQMAPLRVLSIEGLVEGHLNLFDTIAELFPDLTGLTLHRRASTRQRQNKGTPWPLPDWQYAQRMSAFTKLQHFGWNNYKGYFSFTSYPLLYLEEGFEDKNVPRYWERWDERNECISDGNWTQILFATHCPTLRAYASSIYDHSFISGAPGNIIVSKKQGLGSVPYNWGAWDPNDSDPYWPTIRPVKGELELDL